MAKRTTETVETSERRKGREWVRKLSSRDVADLGDAFVLGTFEWSDWLNSKPSAEFLKGADGERITREQLDD